MADDEAPQPIDTSPTTAADNFKWWHFCDMLETILVIAEDKTAAKASKNASTRGAVFAPWTREARLRGESLYPYLRLLVPAEDGRTKYKLKEKRIAECVRWSAEAHTPSHPSTRRGLSRGPPPSPLRPARVVPRCRAYVERLAIAKDHPDAWRLLNWKARGAGGGGEVEASTGLRPRTGPRR
jgi:hypothetical protein